MLNNIQIQKVASFAEFEHCALENIAENHRIQQKDSMHHSDLLFRGHADSMWDLKTTLERYLKCDKFSMEDYYWKIHAIHDDIASVVGKDWKLSDNFEVKKHPSAPDGYEFMVYLRQYGFPSPLLDWTRSIYIAAFFAFHNAQKADYVAIYQYKEYAGGGKGGSGAHIVGLGSTIKTTKRHFIQQAEYTICREKLADKFYYVKHTKAFKDALDSNQDLFIKYEIPISEKDKVMNRLDAMNINQYTLFETEESLLQTLAFRHLSNST